MNIFSSGRQKPLTSALELKDLVGKPNSGDLIWYGRQNGPPKISTA